MVYWPPFCTYCLTNSSLFSSSTSSISSRSESTSSVISLWRSATSVSTEASTSSVSSRVRVALCCPPVSLVAMGASSSVLEVDLLVLPRKLLADTDRTGHPIRARPPEPSAPGDRVDQLLCRGRGLEQCAD